MYPIARLLTVTKATQISD